MPVTLSQIAAKIATVTLEFEGGDSLSIVYYPLRITDTMFAQLQGFATLTEDTPDMDVKFMELSQIMVDIIKSWDLLEDDGATTIALTVKRLSRVSSVIKSIIIQAILEDIRPESLAPQVHRRNGSH